LEIAAAHANLITDKAGVDIVAAADPHMITIHATALPKKPPTVRKPTDLMMDMAGAMRFSMNKLGIKPKTDLNQIYSAQDAVNYLDNAAKLLRRR
jgi:hypothetical protein